MAKLESEKVIIDFVVEICFTKGGYPTPKLVKEILSKTLTKGLTA